MVESPGIVIQTQHRTKERRRSRQGKIYEYMRVGWPVLGIGPPDSETASLLTGCNLGAMFGHDDARNAVSYLEKKYKYWKSGELRAAPVKDKKYNRQYQAEAMAHLLDSLVAQARTS